jgi:hypothetical protein
MQVHDLRIVCTLHWHNSCDSSCSCCIAGRVELQQFKFVITGCRLLDVASIGPHPCCAAWPLMEYLSLPPMTICSKAQHMLQNGHCQHMLQNGRACVLLYSRVPAVTLWVMLLPRATAHSCNAGLNTQLSPCQQIS